MQLNNEKKQTTQIGCGVGVYLCNNLHKQCKNGTTPPPYFIFTNTNASK